MRRSVFPPAGSAVLLLIVLNVAAFLLQLGLSAFSKFDVFRYFALSIDGLRHGYVWQLLTFQLMHGNWLHLLLNCLAIYFIGRELEQVLGRKSFWTLYLSSGAIGGLVQILAGLALGGRYAVPVVGASAGAFGLVAAFATLFPERTLTLLIFFILPVSMRAKFLLLFSVIIAIIGMVFPAPNDNVAHAAHLGGILAGVCFIRYAVHWQWPRFAQKRRQPVRRLVKVHSQKAGPWSERAANGEDLPPEEFLSKEVDPILDKISAQGIQSLTERERRILEAARHKMGKR